MVWLTGGGNHALSGQGTAGFGGLSYSGERFVPQGVIFVSYNLRLGVLGFLAGKEVLLDATCDFWDTIALPAPHL